jgi:hypothetical protein
LVRGVGHHGFVETTPNGVAVRGLRVLRSWEYRRVSIWETLIGAVFGDPTGSEENWSVLTVHDGPYNPVACRRFPSADEANKARHDFVRVVADMSQDVYAQANWQSVLDAL